MNLIPFANEARRHFDCVAMKYGLSCVVADEQRVRYENGEVFLGVNFDNGRSYEIGVEIGQKIPNKVERPFSLAEILRLRTVPAGADIDGLSVSNTTKLADDLQLLSDLTSSHADDFLRGNDLSFAQVAKLREKESIAYEIQRDLRSARAQAEKAWEARNYAGVVAALEPVKSHLSPSEAKRLEYSLTKASS
ncbi:MAG: hypothetical protein LBG44_01380 [Gemmatimonadota bacterium]|jgi:hypothetical protein|nr:hypothetical protein [Gemmatimonadota bacterium]